MWGIACKPCSRFKQRELCWMQNAGMSFRESQVTNKIPQNEASTSARFGFRNGQGGTTTTKFRWQAWKPCLGRDSFYSIKAFANTTAVSRWSLAVFHNAGSEKEWASVKDRGTPKKKRGRNKSNGGFLCISLCRNLKTGPIKHETAPTPGSYDTANIGTPEPKWIEPTLDVRTCASLAPS